MQKASFFILLFIGVVSFMQAQTVRQVGPFDEIVISGDLDVKLEQSDVNEVQLDDREGMDDAVKINIQGRRLKISLLDSWIRKNSSTVRVLVRYERLVDIKVTAGAEVEVSETITTSKLDVKVGSGAKLWLDLDTKVFSGNVSEGGTLTVNGKSVYQEASAATGGIYDAAKLETEETKVKSNTGGEAIVRASELLDAVANTGGKVSYAGNPEQKHTRSNLAGTISKY